MFCFCCILVELTYFAFQNLKNMTVGNRDIKVDHNFLTSVDKLNDMKKQVEFSKIWSRLCFDIKAGRDDVIVSLAQTSTIYSHYCFSLNSVSLFGPRECGTYF